MALLRRKRSYEPKPRLGHYSGVTVGGQCYIFAGRVVDYVKTKDTSLTSTVEVFDQYQEEWRSAQSRDSPPKGLYIGGCCDSPSGDLYVYGGSDGSNFCGGLYKLPGASLEWKELASDSASAASTQSPGPSKKHSCRIVLFDRKKVAVIGGYGPPPDVLQLGASFVRDSRFSYGYGWNNEIHVFDTKESAWLCPMVTGTRPPPVAAFTLTSIDNYRAIMFGGKKGDNHQRINDLYLIDFQTQMVFTKFTRQGGEPWPTERSYHAACCLGFGSENPHLLVTGGVDGEGRTLNDAWLLDVINRKWKKLTLPDQTILLRFGHSITAVYLAPGLIEVTVFGGCPRPITGSLVYEEIPKLAATAILAFEYSDNSWKLMSVANHNELGSKERVLEKIEKIKKYAREARQISSDDGAAGSKEIQKGVQEMIRVADEKVEYAEFRAREAEAQLHELQSHWIIPARDINLTEEKLGTGAYGEVKVATFRETRVAAKCYHQILISEHNFRLFQREIVMAARLRHPNLVQFIGASTERELVLLTELMTTSLGALMHCGPLTEATITSISLDVVKALNYLHLMQPRPIIHRDISSGNVLLNPLPDNQWKAKVSDYGSVNLLEHLNTAHPGNPFYAAPEANNPGQQTPKMDIFSFGVLLLEMLIKELPEQKERPLHILKVSVEHPQFIEIIRDCLNEAVDIRPTAQQLIALLNDLNRV